MHLPRLADRIHSLRKTKETRASLDEFSLDKVRIHSCAAGLTD